MSIEEFLKQFNDIIPFEFKLKIGGPRANMIISDDEHKSYNNFKGKMFPLKKIEQCKQVTEYIPLEEMDAFLDLKVECSYPHHLYWEERPKSTKREMQHPYVRILNEDASKQIGCLGLDLTRAGDICYKSCLFSNEEGTHQITQSVFYRYDDKTKKVSTKEQLSFIAESSEENLAEIVTFYKENGALRCVNYSKQPAKKNEFVGLIWTEGINKIDCVQEYFSRYYNNEPVRKWFHTVGDITNLAISSDHRNCIFDGFVGEYIGNTVIKKDSKETVVIETMKDGYHYFTGIDITGTDAFNYSIINGTHNSPLYFEAMKNTPKIPMFRTKITDEEEVLIPFGDHITDEETKKYEWFKSYCEESFPTIENKKMSSLSIDKYTKSEKKHVLKNTRNTK